VESPSAGPPPSRGPWWAGSPNEPTRALGECRGGTNAREVVAATTSCCGLATAVVTWDGSPTAVELATVRGTLSERLPIVADILNLSALTGTRAGTVGVTLATKEGKG
jgi:hypothetical protein